MVQQFHSWDIPEEYKSGYKKGAYTLMLILALFIIAKLWKQPRCPTTDEWIKKMWYLHTMEFYLATKKRMKFCLQNGWNWIASP
jgi:hypothetical protein